MEGKAGRAALEGEKRGFEKRKDRGGVDCLAGRRGWRAMGQNKDQKESEGSGTSKNRETKGVEALRPGKENIGNQSV